MSLLLCSFPGEAEGGAEQVRRGERGGTRGARRGTATQAHTLPIELSYDTW